MIVFIVSKSEKKAKTKVRQIIDLFADRIGNDCWKTNITKEGLITLKKELCKIASKNMAVSCHWVHKRKTTELLWIIGSKKKFTNTGIVPIASTKNNLTHLEWETTDLILPILKPIVALTALFHDVGKASEGFQKMIKGNIDSDVIRHEWISLLIFLELVGEKSDAELLNDLVNNTDIVLKELELKIQQNGVNFDIRKKKYSKLILFLGILIISHHKTPYNYSEVEIYKYELFDELEVIFKIINKNWGYEKTTENIFINNFSSEVIFTKSIKKEISKYSKKMLNNLDYFYQLETNGGIRSLFFRAKLAINLGDYLCSSKEVYTKGKKNILYANTKNDKLNQTLEEHLLGVEADALKSIYTIKRLINNLPKISNHRELKKSSLRDSKFIWQDKAVNATKRNLTKEEKGFFCVNNASTGTGKTLANAKIMYAANSQSDEFRLNVALGLRTLTLQTGESFRDRLHFDSSEMAVVIGSKEILDLEKIKNDDKEETLDIEENYFIDEISFENYVDYPEIQKIVKSKKDEAFLCAPIVASTIDYFIRATESTIGSKWIIPYLRLMDSDIIIDEIDDFVGKDLIAISRLVYLCGLLGRKVLISSATITPSISIGFFKAYAKGYEIFSKTNSKLNEINCVFVDEFRTKVFNIGMQNHDKGINEFNHYYDNQILKRITSLLEKEKELGVKRKGKILDVIDKYENLSENYYSTIYNSINKIHNDNFVVDRKTKKHISFGLVRFANIEKCIEFTRFIDNKSKNNNIKICTICYHSRQLLLVRNEIEVFLDEVLKRHNEGSSFINIENTNLRNILDNSEEKDVIFITISSPIEEVGRDHDFDWAIVEPSSIRSIIQLSGRVLRHREKFVDNPNVYILEENFKSYVNRSKIVFSRPGYEKNSNKLANHNLHNILDINLIERSINSIPRLNTELLKGNELLKIEHESINKNLLKKADGPIYATDWYESFWYMTGCAQKLNKFRDSDKNIRLYSIYSEDLEDFEFYQKDSSGDFIKVQDSYKISINNRYLLKTSLLKQSLYDIVENISKKLNTNVINICKKFNYIDIPQYFLDNPCEKEYSTNVGLCKKKEDNNG